MIDKFHEISIRGRYTYCYLCLRNVIASQSLYIPDFLNIILKRFTSTSELDVWQDSAEEVLPSVILDPKNEINRFKIISYEQLLDLKGYYSQNERITDVIEKLIWLGMSNLYGGFDSNITFEYTKDMISLMHAYKVGLPSFSIVSCCSVNECRGWGNLVDLDDFLTE